jgi:hypothetical protein
MGVDARGSHGNLGNMLPQAEKKVLKKSVP